MRVQPGGLGAVHGTHRQCVKHMACMRPNFSPPNLMPSFLSYFSGYPAAYPSTFFISEIIISGKSYSHATTTSTNTDHVALHRLDKYSPGISPLPQYPLTNLLFIALAPLVTLSISSMNTRKKNKSAHPGIPDMSALQLASAGLSHIQNARRPPSKKPTKDQQIAALKDELRIAREVISNVMCSTLHYLYFVALTSALSSIIPTTLQHPMTICKSQWTPVAIPMLRLMTKRPRMSS